ncbi:MAG: LOW QUALITY PROTEIN: hypothetical protein KVP17_000526 [Porospora cf. gigantea B]|uniref:uncharacterized protein n=1 Tax=Porospora cf. gigantea B TaxID=2853592 RepID=UPI003571E491|nr:MAG: LOW QUALITY PROTEIN: hypothetical protein KVP17_000526 [Porospora cf. gigantea B]
MCHAVRGYEVSQTNDSLCSGVAEVHLSEPMDQEPRQARQGFGDFGPPSLLDFSYGPAHGLNREFFVDGSIRRVWKLYRWNLCWSCNAGPDAESSSEEDAWLGELSTAAALQRATEQSRQTDGELPRHVADILIHDEHARAVVPHEDKQVYPTAQEVYGDAEVVVHEEDTQPITMPIVDPQVMSTFDAVEAQFPEVSFDFDFMGGHMGLPEFTRLVSVDISITGKQP